jgi:glycine cleavage system regulatory protein
MKHFAVLAIGRDKSGIVAWITGAIKQGEGSIMTSQMARLGDHFSMMLVVAAKDLSRDALREVLEKAASEHDGFEVLVTDVAEYDSHARSEASHLVTVICGERLGVVSAISREFGSREVNITHLNNLVQRGQDGKEWCVTRAYVSIPAELKEETLHDALETALNDTSAAIKLEPLLDPQSSG